MSVLDRPVHVCGECGCVNEDAAARVATLQQQVELLREDVGNLERDLRSKRAQIKRLKADQDAALKQDPLYPDAMEVLAYWRGSCAPKAREVSSGKRLENCIARLRGRYTVEDLKRACEGYSLKPYVVNGKRTHEGPKDSWAADAELIFRDARHVDTGIRIAERADDLRRVMADAPTPAEETPSIGASPLGAVGSPLGQAAIRMAHFGFFVFPCVERGKEPATPSGFKNATRDVARIAAAWAARPHLNVGVRCGSESGIVVLDVDGDEGWDALHRLEDAHGELPTTLSVTTPRGGQHFYFLHPGVEIRNTIGFPAPGLDIRGDGGYVLAPPSIGSGGRQYEVDEQAAPVAMPDWLLAALRGYQSRVDQALSGRTDWVAFLNDAPSQGERNGRMTKYVGHLFGVGMDAREVMATAALLNAQAKPPLSERELASIVKSIARAEARK